MATQYTSRTDRVRILILIEKNPSLSTEEFQEYFLNVHSKIFLKFAEGKEGLIKYEQLHVNQEEKALLKDMGQPVPDYDGALLFDFESFESFEALFSSSEYTSIVGSDLKKFVHTTTALVLRLNIVPIINPEEHVSKSSLNQIRKDRVAILFGFTRKEGISLEEMKKYWFSHADLVCNETRMGREAIKYEQLHPATQCPIRHLDASSSAGVTGWDGFGLFHAPSFATFRHPEDGQALVEDCVKFQAPGKSLTLPVNVAKIIDNRLVFHNMV